MLSRRDAERGASTNGRGHHRRHRRRHRGDHRRRQHHRHRGRRHRGGVGPPPVDARGRHRWGGSEELGGLGGRRGEEVRSIGPGRVDEGLGRGAGLGQLGRLLTATGGDAIVERRPQRRSGRRLVTARPPAPDRRPRRGSGSARARAIDGRGSADRRPARCSSARRASSACANRASTSACDGVMLSRVSSVLAPQDVAAAPRSRPPWSGSPPRRTGRCPGAAGPPPRPTPRGRRGWPRGAPRAR